MTRYRISLWTSKEKRTQTINYAGCSDILISQNHLYKNILHRLQKPTNSSFHVALALFLHEWIDLLTNGETECWEEIEGLYPAIPEISDEMKEITTIPINCSRKAQTVPVSYIWKDIRNYTVSLPKYYNGRTIPITLCPK